MVEGSAHSHVLLEIDVRLCQMCGKCRAKSACHHSAIRVIDRGEPPILDTGRCWGCLVCMPACPFGAVVYHERQADAHV